MDTIAKESPEYRRDLFLEAAEKKGLPPFIIEKDFWVCWVLQHIFSLPSIREHLVFKGGTSLSKVFNVIGRFSEDIDLTIDRTLIGESFPERLSEEGLSGKKREKIIEEMIVACQAFVSNTLKSLLEQNFAGTLGNPNAGGWALEADDSDPNALIFTYPKAVKDYAVYVPPKVKIELGCRAEIMPTVVESVEPYTNTVLQRSSVKLPVLTIQRTFWEKATILHSEYHRPSDKVLPPRYSRHYYDLFRISQSSFKGTSIGDLDLLHRVVGHKQVFFRSGWARYELARPPTLRLVPPSARQGGLRADYVDMKPMFFSSEPIPSFDQILDGLAKLEDEINQVVK